MRCPLPALIAALFLFQGPAAAEEEPFRLPRGMTFHRRPTAPPGAGEPFSEPVPGGTDAADGMELHCGHVRHHVARASAEQMACIRRVTRGFIEEGGNIHFTEDTCDLRAVVLLQRMRARCSYHGAYLMLYNRDDGARQHEGLNPGVPGATRNNVEWTAHWVAGAVDEDGACWSLDPALGRNQGGVVPFREHLALADYQGRAVLAQASRWNGEDLRPSGQSALCRADCLGNFSQSLRGLAADRAEAHMTCITCTQDCLRRFGQGLAKFTCDSVLHPRER